MPRDTENTETPKLTEELLEEHDKNFKSKNSKISQYSGHSWVNQMVQDEQMHLVHSRLGMVMLNKRPSSSEAASERDAQTRQEKQEENSDLLKLFERRQESFQETPMERFLTPGCSDPSYFARPALAKMGTPFGDSQTKEVRMMSAKADVEKAEEMARQVSWK